MEASAGGGLTPPTTVIVNSNRLSIVFVSVTDRVCYRRAQEPRGAPPDAGPTREALNRHSIESDSDSLAEPCGLTYVPVFIRTVDVLRQRKGPPRWIREAL